MHGHTGSQLLLWSTLVTLILQLWLVATTMSSYGQNPGQGTALSLGGQRVTPLNESGGHWAETRLDTSTDHWAETNWDKSGDYWAAMCANAPKLTLITPWVRDTFEFLPIITRSINWDCITQWIVVYDVHKMRVAMPQMQNNPKVLEIFHSSPHSAFGNRQRQEALERVEEGMVYFLDDDNAMHPAFWSWFATNVSLDHIYTFDQLRGHEPLLLTGDKPVPGSIDTAQLLFDRALLGYVSWTGAAAAGNSYDADGFFIRALVAQHPDKHMYVPHVLAYHNFARHFLYGAEWTRLPTHDASISKARLGADSESFEVPGSHSYSYSQQFSRVDRHEAARWL